MNHPYLLKIQTFDADTNTQHGNIKSYKQIKKPYYRTSELVPKLGDYMTGKSGCYLVIAPTIEENGEFLVSIAKTDKMQKKPLILK